MNPENEIPTPTKYPRSESLDSACTHMNDAEKHGVLQVGIRALEAELAVVEEELAKARKIIAAYREDERELEEAQEALRRCCIASGNGDPAESEGTSPETIAIVVERELTALAACKAEVEALRGILTTSNDICRSMSSIADRDGRNTNWPAFRSRLSLALNAQHSALYPKITVETVEYLAEALPGGKEAPNLCEALGLPKESFREFIDQHGKDMP